jgi:hypothetical protein
MQGNIKYQFTTSLWQHNGAGGWHFVSLPEEIAAEIRTFFKSMEEGWGRLKVRAKIANHEWTTAIWYDTKRKTYLLPVKASIRITAQLTTGDVITVVIWV